MRPLFFAVTVATLFTTAPLALAQSPAPTATPAAEATPAKKHRKKAEAATPAPAAATPAPAMMTPAPAAAGSTPAPAKMTRAEKKAAKAQNAAPVGQATPNATAAPGGGAGMVWVNTKSHVYHGSSSRWYGKTKQGKYLSEKDAVAEGDKAAPRDQ